MSPEAIAVRDALADSVLNLGTFGTVKRSIAEQLEPGDQLPAATVFLIRESMDTLGDANAGEPSFTNTITLGIVVTICHAEQKELEPTLTYYANQILAVLLQDPDFLAGVEAVASVSQSQSFPASGETYYGEGRIEAAIVCYPKFWEPIVPDAYLRTTMTTRFTDSPDAPAIKTTVDRAQS